MEYETKIVKVGGSKAVILPPMFLQHIQGNIHSKIIMKDDEGKHGKFISIWTLVENNE